MQDLSALETTWSIELPTSFVRLYDDLEWDALRLDDGTVFRVFHSPLLVKEIIDAFELRADWELPEKFVPFLGNFHSLLGLDYSSTVPGVVALSDSRDARRLFVDFDSFLEARIHVEEDKGEAPRIVESESWLDI